MEARAKETSNLKGGRVESGAGIISPHRNRIWRENSNNCVPVRASPIATQCTSSKFACPKLVTRTAVNLTRVCFEGGTHKRASPPKLDLDWKGSLEDKIGASSWRVEPNNWVSAKWTRRDQTNSAWFGNAGQVDVPSDLVAKRKNNILGKLTRCKGTTRG